MDISPPLPRILVLNNLYPPQELGGYGRSLFDFAINLRQLGHHIHVLTSDAPYLGGDLSGEQGVDRRLQLLGTYEHGIHPLSDNNEVSRINHRNLVVLNDVLCSFKPDAVLVGNIDMLSPNLLLQIIQSGVHCWHHYGFASSTLPLHLIPFDHPFYHPLGGSHHTSKELGMLMPSRRPIPVIYTAAEVNQFLDLPLLPLKEPLKIAYAGLMMGSKGPQVLLSALTQLRQQGIAFNAEFAGGFLDANGLEPFQAFADRGGISNHVRFLGKLDRQELRLFYGRHQVFVFPSIHPEGFGIVQVEAMASGLLVVSSGDGGARETVHDDVNGRRFKPGDPDELARVLVEIVRNPSRHEQLRLFGRRLAITHFDIRASTRKLSMLISRQFSR